MFKIRFRKLGAWGRTAKSKTMDSVVCWCRVCKGNYSHTRQTCWRHQKLYPNEVRNVSLEILTIVLVRLHRVSPQRLVMPSKAKLRQKMTPNQSPNPSAPNLPATISLEARATKTIRPSSRPRDMIPQLTHSSLALQFRS